MDKVYAKYSCTNKVNDCTFIPVNNSEKDDVNINTNQKPLDLLLAQINLVRVQTNTHFTNIINNTPKNITIRYREIEDLDEDDEDEDMDLANNTTTNTGNDRAKKQRLKD